MKLIFVIFLFVSSFSFSQEVLRTNSFYKGTAIYTGCGSDADAQKYCDSAGITNTKYKCALIQLVTDLKSYGLWTKMYAIYPMLWGDTTHSGVPTFNLKNTATFRAATGGLSNNMYKNDSGLITRLGYINTGFIPSINATASSLSLSYYSGTNQAASTSQDMGSITGGIGYAFADLILKYTGNLGYSEIDSAKAGQYATASVADSRGLFTATRISTTNNSLYRNGALLNTATTSTNSTPSTFSIFIGATNNNGAVQFYSLKICSFASIGQGLTSTDVTNLYTAVQSYETALGRQM